MDKLKKMLVTALLCASACAGTYTYSTVADPPPEAYYEVRGPAPYADAVWINGYWSYSNGGYVWQRGHYTHARQGYVWVPHHWVHEGRGYRLNQGYWRPYQTSYYR